MAKKSRVLNLRENEIYYSLAKEGSLDLSHPWVKLLINYAKNASNILDVGCGEGTRLANILTPSQKGAGVDISKTAIEIAKKQYPNLDFIQTEENSLPFKDETFDLVYSAFVLEHTTDTEKFIDEIIRVLRKDGILILVAPNFGAPNRRSPNSTQSATTKLLNGMLKDIRRLFTSNEKNLNWKSVEPKSDTYTMDSDTTVEPYLLTLKDFLHSKDLNIEKCSSSWDQDTFSVSQILFKIHGVVGIYPFNYWGPHLVIAARKLN